MRLLLLCVFILVISVSIKFCPQARPTGWTPEGRSKEDWLSTLGMRHEQYQRYLSLLQEYKQKKGEIRAADAFARNESNVMDDVILSTDQLEVLTGRRRQRRSIIPFDGTHNKWSMPIPFKIDSDFDSEEHEVIRSAIRIWASQTCVSFVEMPLQQTYTASHIIFTKDTSDLCLSYLGRSENVFPQPIILTGICSRQVGSVLHEVGHALGLQHEHTRPDRDDYIRIMWNNIRPGRTWYFQYEKSNSYLYANKPYDFASIMHYGSRDFSVDYNSRVIETLNPVYQQTMFGHQPELSYLDTKLINYEYCRGTCTDGGLCQNGGYPNPKDCRTCLCPDGLTGDFCQVIAPGIGNFFPSSSARLIARDQTACISSPNFETGGTYRTGDSGSWLLESESGSRIDMWLSDWFNLPCEQEFYQEGCIHWLEIKLDEPPLTAARFCCYRPPALANNLVLTSVGSRALVTFRSNHPPPAFSSGLQGFKLCYRARTSLNRGFINQTPPTPSPRQTTPVHSEIIPAGPKTPARPGTTTTASRAIQIPTAINPPSTLERLPGPRPTQPAVETNQPRTSNNPPRGIVPLQTTPMAPSFQTNGPKLPPLNSFSDIVKAVGGIGTTSTTRLTAPPKKP